MTRERWEQIKSIVSSALERTPGEQPALTEVCAGDAALRAEVDSLIAAHEAAGTFMDTSAVANSATPDAGRLTETSRVGRRIGPYEVIRELGHGGMGVVYLATRADQAFDQQVAIKLVRGGLDDSLLAGRFREERQILANLTHACIARLLDGGATDEGLPYLVMEYVEGAPIDRFCERHGLDTRQRLELFRQVCGAVHYAHCNLVIHRDLKPNNILVTAEGTPKLLDFGIAKLLKADTNDSTFTRRVFTPEYASPEQVRGERMTTASDVYSLGMLLYLLLTGRHPHSATTSDPLEQARLTCEIDPAAPATVAKDLDTIVLKALRKEPSRRYGSVEQLSDDIGRYLRGLPVLAVPDTLRYRTAKFVRRHTASVVSAAVLMLLLAGAALITTWQASIANRERSRAERRFNDVRKLANAVVGDLHDAIKDLPGSTAARRLLVMHALEYLDGLALEAAGDTGLQLDLAAAYEKVGDVQGQPTYGNLGDSAGARRSYEKALSIRQALAAVDSNDVTTQRALAANYRKLGRLLHVAGADADALAAYEQAHSIATRLAHTRAQNPDLRGLVAATHGDLAWHLATHDPVRALVHAQEAVAISQQFVAMRPNEFAAQERLAISLERVGRVLDIQAPSSGAGLPRFREAGAIWDRLLASDPVNTSVRWSVLANRTLLAETLRAKGETADALMLYGQAVDVAEALAAGDSASAEYQSALATCLLVYGETQLDAGLASDAQASLRRSVAILDPLARGTPADHEVRVNLAEAQRALIAAQAAVRRSPSAAMTRR